MTVRANKPAFNIREKLKELERPIGVKGNELIRAETAQDARDFISAGRKNLVINGDMRIAQRGTSQTSVNSSGYYAVDRFQSILNSLGVWTVSRESDAPDGFQYSLKHTCTTADATPAASDYAIVYHKFEKQNIEHLKYGSSAAQDVTLSFWVKSNKTGSASVGVFFYGSGDNRFINRTYTINASDTWEYKTVTFKGNTDFPFSSSNTSSGFSVEWWMNSGSTYQGNTENTWTIGEGRNISNLGVGGATSDYFSLTGVQLEVGKNATEFEPRSYGEELTLCKRYYQRWNGNDSDFNAYDSGANRSGLTSVARSTMIAQGVVHDSDDANVSAMLDVEMRSFPTVVLPSGNNSIRIMVGPTIYDNASYVQENNCFRNILSVFVDNGGAMTANQPASLILRDANSYLALDAEL